MLQKQSKTLNLSISVKKALENEAWRRKKSASEIVEKILDSVLPVLSTLPLEQTSTHIMLNNIPVPSGILCERLEQQQQKEKLQ